MAGSKSLLSQTGPARDADDAVEFASEQFAAAKRIHIVTTAALLSELPITTTIMSMSI